jgi:hypothetical protein
MRQNLISWPILFGKLILDREKENKTVESNDIFLFAIFPPCAKREIRYSILDAGWIVD